MALLDDLCRDLEAEHADVDRILAPLNESDWLIETTAPGWTVREQVSHLRFGDERASLAGRDPEAFEARRRVEMATDDTWARAMVASDDTPTGASVWAAWKRARVEFVSIFRAIDPKIRVPWYGLPMSPASKVTARIMETWAHGQDLADTFGVERTPTDRLRHVAHIGVGARKFSYMAHKREFNEAPVFVSLRSPSGAAWEWGDASAADSVRGPALDFALLITQRRHLDDTALDVVGDAAREWMAIGQAFAGPPGAGRRPGQFRKVK